MATNTKSKRFTKADIEFHSDGYGRGSVPAVNVKVRGYLSDQEVQAFIKANNGYGEIDARFTREWIEEHVSEEMQSEWFNTACEDAWEQLGEDAKEIFGQHTKVYSQGRSGGWAVIDGFDRYDVESWDALAVAKWGRFSKWAKQCADGVIYTMIDLIYYNTFGPWAEEQAAEAAEPERAREAAVMDVATMPS